MIFPGRKGGLSGPSISSPEACVLSLNSQHKEVTLPAASQQSISITALDVTDGRWGDWGGRNGCSSWNGQWVWNVPLKILVKLWRGGVTWGQTGWLNGKVQPNIQKLDGTGSAVYPSGCVLVWVAEFWRSWLQWFGSILKNRLILQVSRLNISSFCLTLRLHLEC